ncbi:hypothetical protein [uncultured Oscillibacter sp.]|uniref:hypothetical protein n=1 Tax=uncultured Oscillibacter sp. TaxID=876091 RepID=UPI0025DC3888|nr:hypothetical protein [uncultured Oscillibacter sp.]
MKNINISIRFDGDEPVINEVSTNNGSGYADSDSAPIVFLRFIHEDEADNRKVTIDMYKAQFTGELELDFNKKDAVSFNYAFDLLAKDNGTKHVYFNVAEKALA